MGITGHGCPDSIAASIGLYTVQEDPSTIGPSRYRGPYWISKVVQTCGFRIKTGCHTIPRVQRKHLAPFLYVYQETEIKVLVLKGVLDTPFPIRLEGPQVYILALCFYIVAIWIDDPFAIQVFKIRSIECSIRLTHHCVDGKTRLDTCQLKGGQTLGKGKNLVFIFAPTYIYIPGKIRCFNGCRPKGQFNTLILHFPGIDPLPGISDGRGHRNVVQKVE